ncbi:MAG: hypothetical protein OEY70_10015, partial [Acidimicrobiia bacterium]|nr:hypothetical protein [Acidimicrobiia bacterium]
PSAAPVATAPAATVLLGPVGSAAAESANGWAPATNGAHRPAVPLAPSAVARPVLAPAVAGCPPFLSW